MWVTWKIIPGIIFPVTRVCGLPGKLSRELFSQLPGYVGYLENYPGNYFPSYSGMWVTWKIIPGIIFPVTRVCGLPGKLSRELFSQLPGYVGYLENYPGNYFPSYPGMWVTW